VLVGQREEQHHHHHQQQQLNMLRKRGAVTALLGMRQQAAAAASSRRTLAESSTNAQQAIVSTKKSEASTKDLNVHELRVLKIHPAHLNDYVQLSEEAVSHKIKEGAKMIGCWNVTLGECTNEVVQIWQWESYKHREQATENLAHNPAWEKYTRTVKPMIQNQNYSVILPFPFWPLVYPETKGGIYELRTYNLIPGAVWVWGDYWEQGLKHRSKYIQPIAAWYTEIGVLNTVHHIWHFDNMDQRRQLREAVWDEPGWSEVVELTHPLIQKMDSRIMHPTSFSSLQ